MNNASGKILFVVVLVAVGFTTYLRTSSRQATQRFEQSAKEFKQKAQALMQRQMAGEDVGAEHEKLFSDFIAEADKAGNEASGKDARAMRAIGLTLRDLQGPMRAYNAAFTELMSAGGSAPEGIKSVADVEKRLALIEKLREGNEALDAVFKAMPDRMKTNLQAADLPSSEIESALNGFRSNAKLDLVAQIRQSDRDLVAAMRGQFELLKSEFGKWKLVEGGAVEFQNNAAADKFDKLYHDIQAAADKQEKLQRQALGR